MATFCSSAFAAFVFFCIIQQCNSQTCTCTVPTDRCSSSNVLSTDCAINQVCGCHKLDVPDCPLGMVTNCLTLDTNAPQSTTTTCACGGTPFICRLNSAGSSNRCGENEACPCTKFSALECSNTMSCLPLLNSGGNGDPHFIGFDGSRYDFHGENRKSYVVYGEENGDLLVANFKATNEMRNGLNKTYFYQLGLQPASSKQKVLVFLDQTKRGKWELRVSVNGHVIPSQHSMYIGNTTSFLPSSNRRSIKVQTSSHIFTFTGTSLNSKYRHHLDFKLTRKRDSPIQTRFTGILGVTMSRKMGNPVHEKLFKNHKNVEFELMMRQYYSVGSLFPTHHKLRHLYSNLD